MTRHRLPIAVVVACGVLVIAGCGSSSKPSVASTGPSKKSPLSFMMANLKWAECIRSHGVPKLPDPTFGAGGAQVNLSTPAGMLTSPQFFAAERACAKLGLYGAGAAAQEPPSPAQMAQALTVSKCMRAHAIYDFPDTTSTPPSNGVHVVEFGDGVSLAIPISIDMSSPLFTRAATTCGFPLPPLLHHS